MTHRVAIDASRLNTSSDRQSTRCQLTHLRFYTVDNAVMDTPTADDIRTYLTDHYRNFDPDRHIHRLAVKEHVSDAIHSYNFQIAEAQRRLWKRIQDGLTDEEIRQFYLDLSWRERDKIQRSAIKRMSTQ